MCNEQSGVVKHFNLYLLFLFSVILSNYIPNSDFIPVNLPYVLETFCKYPFTTEVKYGYEKNGYNFSLSILLIIDIVYCILLLSCCCCCYKKLSKECFNSISKKGFV